MDQGKVVILILLDLSSAFDTVDHTILVNRLISLGIWDNALDWIKDYLSNRTQSVVVDEVTSPPMQLLHGVPQGSVLGPLLFVVYMTGIGPIIEKHGVKYKLYADDVQLYISSTPASFGDSISKLERCVDEVKKWLISNMLFLNESKTEAIVLGSAFKLRACVAKDIMIGNHKITFKQTVRNLGIMLDNNLTMHSDTSRICRAAFLQLKLIGRVRRCMNYHTRLRAIQALVLSQMEFGLSLYSGIGNKHLQRIQRIINASARFVVGVPRCDSITPTLLKLGWLPIKLRVEHKILCLVHQTLHGCAPSYLKNILSFHSSSRDLRSSDHDLLAIRKTHTNMGDRAFSVYGARLWNKLPQHIRGTHSRGAFCGLLLKHLMTVWNSDCL
jgi:hypothetical protein